MKNKHKTVVNMSCFLHSQSDELTQKLQALDLPLSAKVSEALAKQAYALLCLLEKEIDALPISND